MPKSESSYYAVRVGYKPGIYSTWEECKKQVNKFPGCRYKKFSKLSEAQAFIAGAKPTGTRSELKPEPTIIDRSSEDVSLTSTSMIKVWTDGCSLSNGKDGARAGVGVYWGAGDPKLPGPRQTNNRAEVMAIIRALETSYNSWIPNWEKNGWKTSTNKDVENKDLF
ncbi:2208_t:CDS:2, partial [Acaulospora morrowiae]